MNVEVTESALVDGLAEMLRGFGYAVVRTGRQRLYVDLGAEQRGAAALLGSAELELDLHLVAWQAGHPDAVAERIDGASRGGPEPLRRFLPSIGRLDCS